MQLGESALEIQVSLDGERFATERFPPGMNPETHVGLIFYHKNLDLD